ncbi:MAG TPA: rhodanese-like domain-containing protein [Pirellulales bacterium]|nr:rhodanese-like domain-containing protein [Pirellulales bacterium]
MTSLVWIVILLALVALGIWLWLRSGVPHDDAERLRRIERYYRVCARLLPSIPEISAAELLERRRESRLAIVDVRKPHEQAVSMIPGAISQAEFEARKDEFRDAPVVAYCTLGFRSGKFVAQLRAEGFDACNLRGAILAWTHARQPLVDAQGETRRVHVYGRKWNLVASGYEGVW